MCADIFIVNYFWKQRSMKKTAIAKRIDVTYIQTA